MVDDIRAPAAWRRPKTKIYDYNQDMGCAYYKVLFSSSKSSSYDIDDWDVLTTRLHIHSISNLGMCSLLFLLLDPIND